MLLGMFSVSDAEAAAIRVAYEQGGELAAAGSCADAFQASSAPPRHGNARASSQAGSRCCFVRGEGKQLRARLTSYVG